MGARSTILVTRSAARTALFSALLNAPDERLEHWLDELLDERLLNCQIVPDGDESAEDHRL